MKDLKVLRLQLLNKINYQREYLGNVDIELCQQYDLLSEYISQVESVEKFETKEV